MFALSLLPMIGMVGIGIDVSRALATKTVLDASADAAALAAVTQASATIQTSPLLGTTAATTAGIQQGQQIFAVDATRVGVTIGGVPTPTITMSKSGLVLTALVTYSTTSPNYFGKIFGVKTTTLSGSATASLTLPTYMNISVAIDISQSMGLASTSAYMTQLQGLTGGCAFGCHVYQAGQTGLLPYETQAHNAGIQLRIDVIRSATQSMITTAQSLAGTTPLITFGLYTIQFGLTTLAAPSSAYAALLTAAGTIDLGANTSAGLGDTAYATAMPTLTTTVPTSGDGSTSTSPKQFVFIMTDGVQDVYGASCTSTHCTQAFDPAYCTALKAKGVTVGVIYTTYLAMPSETTYQNLVAPFIANIPTNLKSCATSGWYYEASDATAIQSAVSTLFTQATSHGLLTQ